MVLEYRSCVVAVFQNTDGLILVGERSDTPGAWQLPQGGIEPGESAMAALYREMREEVGSDRFLVKNQGNHTVKYRFPEGMTSAKSKKYCGQSQQWFLVSFDQDGKPNLDVTGHEFRAFAWHAPRDIVNGIITWKKDAYIAGFASLNIKIE